MEVRHTCKILLTKKYLALVVMMVGRSSGVVTRLKKHNSEMISARQAAESIAYLKHLDNHLITLFYYFKNSAVCETALYQIQEIMEEPVLCLKRASGSPIVYVYTRLPHLRT